MMRSLKPVVAALAVALFCASTVLAADLSTPRKAALAFATALTSGDAAGARAACDIKNENQGKVIDAFAGMMASFRELSASARAKFGDAAGDLGGEMSAGDLIKKAADADEKIDGDNATLSGKEDDDPLRLVKVGGKWKVVVPEEMASDEMIKSLPAMTAMGNAARETAREIGDGKYKTVDEAKQALGIKMMTAMMGAAAATQPAE